MVGMGAPTYYMEDRGINSCGGYFARENFGGKFFRHPCKSRSLHCLTHTLHCQSPPDFASLPQHRGTGGWGFTRAVCTRPPPPCHPSQLQSSKPLRRMGTTPHPASLCGSQMPSLACLYSYGAVCCPAARLPLLFEFRMGTQTFLVGGLHPPIVFLLAELLPQTKCASSPRVTFRPVVVSLRGSGWSWRSRTSRRMRTFPSS